MRFGLMTWSTTLASFVVAGALVAAGCGDDSTGGDTKSDVPLFDGDANFPDGTDVLQDTGTGTSPDVADTRDTSAPDLIPDLDAPTVVSTTPAANSSGATLPLTITIVFSEPVYAPTIATQTIKLLDWLDNEVPGTPTLGADGKTVTWKPTTNNQQLASAYTIRVVGNFVSDLAGNKIANNTDFEFTTANYPNQDAYQVLAAKYAPDIYSGVAGDLNAQMQVPTKFDGDGDWNLGNNRQWITTGATQLIPAVYYAVSETRTHYFITYTLYFPYIKLEPPEPASLSHTNGSTGTMVVVEKARGETAERPLAAFNYWRVPPTNAENYAFVTTESDIVPGSTSASSWGVKAEMDQAVLFPSDRLELYVSANYHRTCLKGWNEGGVAPPCRWTSEQADGHTLVFKYSDGTPTPVVKKDNKWPSTMADVTGAPASFSYALIPMWSSLWPRRLDTGDTSVFAVTSFVYTPDGGRPGTNLRLTGKFVETLGADLSSFGRPPWAWEFDPSSGSAEDLHDDIKLGQISIDPAHYVWERHHRTSSANGLVDYVPETGVGFSQDYCFNGFVNIDVRTTDLKCVAE